MTSDIHAARDFVVAELTDVLPIVESMIESAREASHAMPPATLENFHNGADALEQWIAKVRAGEILECLGCDQLAVGLDSDGEPACADHLSSRSEGLADRKVGSPPSADGPSAPRGASPTTAESALPDVGPEGTSRTSSSTRRRSVGPSACSSPPTWRGDSEQLKGRAFGRLVVEAPAALARDGSVQVGCRCTCGRFVIRKVRALLDERSTACRHCPALSSGARRPAPSPKASMEALVFLEQLHRDPALVQKALYDIDRIVYLYLVGRYGRGSKRVATQRREARAAALRRVDRARPAALPELLGVSVTVETVYQWIKRGREIAAAALAEEIERTRESKVERIRSLEMLRELLAVASRRDEGKPRPARRKARA